jgi:hypothetical protein
MPLLLLSCAIIPCPSTAGGLFYIFGIKMASVEDAALASSPQEGFDASEGLICFFQRTRGDSEDYPGISADETFLGSSRMEEE